MNFLGLFQYVISSPKARLLCQPEQTSHSRVQYGAVNNEEAPDTAQKLLRSLGNPYFLPPLPPLETRLKSFPQHPQNLNTFATIAARHLFLLIYVVCCHVTTVLLINTS